MIDPYDNPIFSKKRFKYVINITKYQERIDTKSLLTALISKRVIRALDQVQLVLQFEAYRRALNVFADELKNIVQFKN